MTAAEREEEIAGLYLVHYCHRSCIPLKNIMRLPRQQAFALARQMAQENKETTAFYCFADFENYYPRRLETNRLLYSQFIKLGGKPKEEHPLSFVLQGSEYLDNWFDNGLVTRPLHKIAKGQLSFTYGDSMSNPAKAGLLMLIRDMLVKVILTDAGMAEEFILKANRQYGYIEAQLWGISAGRRRTPSAHADT